MILEKVKRIFLDIFDVITKSNIQKNTQMCILYIFYTTFILVPIMSIIGFLTLLLRYPITLLILFLLPAAYCIYNEVRFRYKNREKNEFIDAEVIDKEKKDGNA